MSQPETFTATTSDKPTKTSYLILVEQTVGTVPSTGDGPVAWREVGTIEASSADAAIRKYLGKTELTDSTIVAVPVRSFTKRTPRIVTETRLVLE